MLAANLGDFQTLALLHDSQDASANGMALRNESGKSVADVLIELHNTQLEEALKNGRDALNPNTTSNANANANVNADANATDTNADENGSGSDGAEPSARSQHTEAGQGEQSSPSLLTVEDQDFLQDLQAEFLTFLSDKSGLSRVAVASLMLMECCPCLD